ncbi:unnamed protein product [Notodromas monacha]|uniref:Ig-like domain-containing protein n=1 Tax=Notodromas monacha TaxID=399045 RepID=A0A7R9BX53_9CRUS|nr:unnamed protein product [Notodromas monacha]CAG0922432.1 unnamed protein product [Notodromas monacha]
MTTSTGMKTTLVLHLLQSWTWWHEATRGELYFETSSTSIASSSSNSTISYDDGRLLFLLPPYSEPSSSSSDAGAVLLMASSSSSSSAGLADPDFLGPIANISVPMGKEAVLECHVTNLGPFKVGWIQADTQTILSLHKRVITHNPRIWVSSDDEDRTWRLHIRRVKATDKGCYMCQINTAHMKKQTGCIDVNVPPDILSNETSTDTTVQEGTEVRLVCRARGHPKPKIVWRREDGKPLVLRNANGTAVLAKQLEGEELRLRAVKRRQSGAYSCIAKNAVPPSVAKRIILNINFKPEIRPVDQIVTGTLLGNATLACHLEAYPSTINYWVRNNTEILLNGSKYLTWEDKVHYETDMRLTILGFTPDDTGAYSCRTGNSLGDVQATIQVEVNQNAGAGSSSSSRRRNNNNNRPSSSSSDAGGDRSNKHQKSSSSVDPSSSSSSSPAACSAGFARSLFLLPR